MGHRGIVSVQHPAKQRQLSRISLVWFIFLTLALLLAVSSSNIKAQNEFSSSHIYTYGQTATFILNSQDASVNDNYTLYIDATDMNVQSYNVQPVNNQLVLERNLRDYPLPPFGMVTYWWEYTDAANTLVSTTKTTFQYIDNRFSWQHYADQGINLNWVSGDKSTLINTTTIARDTLTEVQYALQTSIAPQVDVYFYPSALDLQSALQLAGYHWVAGASYPELGVILLSVTDGNQALSQIQRNMPHELTHKILYDLYGREGYKNIPTWLVEGLASHFEPTPDPAYALALKEASSSSSLLRLESLCHPFPEDQRLTLLSYAQSASITNYIQKNYGWSSIRILLQRYAEDGLECAAGIEEVLGMQPLDLERTWRVWLETQSQTGQNPENPDASVLKFSPQLKAAISIFINDAARWLILCAFLILPFLAFGIQFLLEKKSTK